MKQPNTIAAGFLAVALVGCASGEQEKSQPGAELGTVSMALETTTSSGNRYRLRQAKFLLDRSTRALGDALPFPTPDVPPGLDLDELFGPETFERQVTLDSEDNILAPEMRAEVRTGDYRIFLQNGWFLQRLEGGQAVEVEANLEGSHTQVFRVSGGANTVVSYRFLTNGEEVVFDRGTVVVRPEVIEEDGGPIIPQPDATGALIETNLDALSALPLRDVMDAVGRNGRMFPDGELLYQSIIDSYASEGSARLLDATHCGSENPDGPPTLNGYPITCDRLEHEQFDFVDSWTTTAAVNRVDLAPEDGAHCGQQRLVFANSNFIGNGRMFIIVEAQIPNPAPECGIAGCQMLAQAWQLLASEPEPFARGELLREAFLDGSPVLQGSGFEAFIRAENLTVGTGQIRTNNFNDSPWTLREFKVVTDPFGELAMAIPFPTAEAPNGELWNDLSPLPQGEACRQNFLDAMDGLLTDNPARMAFVVDQACKDAESRNDFSQDYLGHLLGGSGLFMDQIAERLVGTDLSPEDIASRAHFAGSCIGCHEEAVGVSLGNGVFAPPSAGFVHISEQIIEPCADGTVNCSGLSPALRDVFLPHRANIHQALLQAPSCGGMVDPIPDDAGAGFGDGGVDFPEPPEPPFPGFPPFGGPVPRPGAGPVPPPLTGTVTVDDLVEAEDAARGGLRGMSTIGGEPAQSTH